MLTQQGIQEFLISRGGLRAKTLNEYRRHLELFRQAFPDKLPTLPVSVQAWLNSQVGIHGQQLAPETVHALYRTLRAMYRQLDRWHPKLDNPMPMVRPPQLKPKPMRAFCDEELYALFRNPLTTRDRALLTLLVDVGARAGECANLTWDDVMRGFVVLRGKTGDRIVPVSDSTYHALQAVPRVNEHVFTGRRGPLSYEGIYKTVRRLCRQAGITGSRASPHTFRHTFGTYYAAADGCDPKALQMILGHRDAKTTLRYIQDNPLRTARNHRRCTPLRSIPGLAQGSLFPDIISEAEAVLAAGKAVTA